MLVSFSDIALKNTLSKGKFQVDYILREINFCCEKSAQVHTSVGGIFLSFESCYICDQILPHEEIQRYTGYFGLPAGRIGV